VVWGDSSTEVSETAKVGTDEQELNKRLYRSGKVAQLVPTPRYLTNTQNITEVMSTYTVDSAGIDRRIFTLPREVWKCKDGSNASAEEQTPLGNKQSGNYRSQPKS